MNNLQPKFEHFEALYLMHIRAVDRPKYYVAYLRAEADHVRKFGTQRFNSYNAFRVALCRARRRRRLQRKTL